MLLPPVVGAVAWFAIKAALTVASALLCFRMARGPGREFPPWAMGLVLLLSLRPILSDLHHGNINLMILFLIVGTLYLWTRGRDIPAGLTLALAISYKVTPALFVPYFLYKRSWRVVLWTGLGMGIFLLVVPSVVLGPEFNGECLAMWWHRIIRPFAVSGFASPQEINQSMVGVLTRLLTAVTVSEDRNNLHRAVNLVAWDPARVALGIKALSVGMVGLLAFFCRTRADRRDDPRLFGEFALVVLTMLFVSERSWKHHYVTILLPVTYMVYRAAVLPGPSRVRTTLAGALALTELLMASTSSELGGLIARDGHKLAQAYGMFLAAGVVLYAATAWRVEVERREPAGGPGRVVPRPHVGAPGVPARST
jgi:hypothetical protein